MKKTLKIMALTAALSIVAASTAFAGFYYNIGETDTNYGDVEIGLTNPEGEKFQVTANVVSPGSTVTIEEKDYYSDWGINAYGTDGTYMGTTGMGHDSINNGSELKPGESFTYVLNGVEVYTNNGVEIIHPAVYCFYTMEIDENERVLWDAVYFIIKGQLNENQIVNNDSETRDSEAATHDGSSTESYFFWKQNHIGWWVQCSDGSYLQNQWYKDTNSGLWYYMGADGYMLTNCNTPDGCYVNADGVWVEGFDSSKLSPAETTKAKESKSGHSGKGNNSTSGQLTIGDGGTLTRTTGTFEGEIELSEEELEKLLAAFPDSFIVGEDGTISLSERGMTSTELKEFLEMLPQEVRDNITYTTETLN